MSHKILVADDTPVNVKLLADWLTHCGYTVLAADNGRIALDIVAKEHPDMVLLDVVMPGMNGYEVCREIRANPVTTLLPVIMVTALDPAQERIKGLEAGADDFIAKPINRPELLARVRSLLRIKELHDTVETQASKLREWNRTLEERVQQQVSQLERFGRLKRFFSPQLAEVILQDAGSNPLRSHRREVTVVFIDLRGFTAFSETTEPEEVMGVLQHYHAQMGHIVMEHEGVLERFSGDGMMVFFNDPIEVSNHQERAVRMAIDMKTAAEELHSQWRKQGHDLDFGVGVATGYATIGLVGYEGRWDYGVIGTVTNLAARLCAEAKPSQILVSQRFLNSVEHIVEAEFVGELTLKGFHRPITTHNVRDLK